MQRSLALMKSASQNAPERSPHAIDKVSQLIDGASLASKTPSIQIQTSENEVNLGKAEAEEKALSAKSLILPPLDNSAQNVSTYDDISGYVPHGQQQFLLQQQQQQQQQQQLDISGISLLDDVSRDLSFDDSFATASPVALRSTSSPSGIKVGGGDESGSGSGGGGRSSGGGGRSSGGGGGSSGGANIKSSKSKGLKLEIKQKGGQTTVAQSSVIQTPPYEFGGTRS